MNLRLKPLYLRSSAVIVLAIGSFNVVSSAQTAPATPAEQQQKEQQITNAKIASGDLTAEQVAELTIALYGFPNGRATLEQIRKTAVERGKVDITDAAGKKETANYQRWYLRGDDGIEKLRIDQQFPNVRFSLISNGNDVFGVFNDSVFVPREDATRSFDNQRFHSIDALLRYKENGSTLVHAGPQKILGVDYHVVDMTDKQGRKTRYFISAKRFRVMMLEYESAGTEYQRKFYDYNYAQGTLVPFRSVLRSGDRVLEEIDVGTITFGQKVEEGLFAKP